MTGPRPARDFLRAYSLNPNNAFTLNNLGYVAEKDGDLESAQFYYEKAQRADNAGTRVGFASQLAAEGRSLNAVANDSNDKVDGALEVYSQQRRRQTGPVELTPRGDSGANSNQPTETPKVAPSPSPSTTPQQQAPQPH